MHPSKPQLLFLLLFALAAAGCPPTVDIDAWGERGGASTGDAHVLRRDATGPILLVFADHPLEPHAPPSGLHRAALDAAGYAQRQHLPLSAAVFHRGAAERGEQWLNAEISRRRYRGEAGRVVLAGAGFSGAAAGEAAWRVLRHYPDVTVESLVTVDAVKSGAVSRTTGMATAALKSAAGGRDTVAYDNAPRPDGDRMRALVNYYQTDTALRHGAPMNGATVNERITAPGRQAVTHANIDDHAYPLVRADFVRALWGKPWAAGR